MTSGCDIKRRRFLQQSAFSAGTLILPSGIVRGTTSPSSKLHIALIGAHGRATAHYGWMGNHNVVALCDVVEANLKPALERFPKAKTYIDWRKCLDHPGLDAVVICTADHHHAMISNWALNRDLHVYCEKPLAIGVEESRVLREKWLTKKGRLATQVGTQMHAQPNYARIREMIRDGAIGELQGAVAWGNRKIPRAGYFPAKGSPPPGLHWDLWLGPSQQRPYHPDYFTGKPGSNCLQWNMFWDWGAGQIGDMGCHMMDLVWSVIDAKLPTRARAEGDPYNPEVTPVELQCHFDHPANDWRGPIRVSWHQGGSLPRSPRHFIDFDKIGHGAMFHGTEGFLIADYTRRLLIPAGKDGDLSYYQPRKKEEQIPPVGHFQEQWIAACMDPSKSTGCDFEYHGDMMEQMMLGLVAYRAGETIEYDGQKGTVTNHPEANALLKRTYREGWSLDG